MKTTRAYTMTGRAAAAAATRQRILDAVVALVMQRTSLEIVLADVAGAAGVSIQTVLRHFGSREALFDAAWAYGSAQVVHEREAPVGDVVAAVRVIFDHYEQRGDAMLRFLEREHSDRRVRELTEHGRAVHRAWVERVFALGDRPEPGREELTDLLVIATDVYTWKILRRDRGLDRPRAQARVRHLIHTILKGGTS